jgi:hypothetical protein
MILPKTLASAGFALVGVAGKINVAINATEANCLKSGMMNLLLCWIDQRRGSRLDVVVPSTTSRRIIDAIVLLILPIAIGEP